MLLAIEAVPASQRVIAAAVALAVQSRAEVLVLSVRERDYARGFVWDVRPAGDVAEVVTQALYELQRVNVPARGVVATARAGKVADEIVCLAEKNGVSEIVIGLPRRSWLARLLGGSVGRQLLQRSPIPVVAIPSPAVQRPTGIAVRAYPSATAPKR